MGAWNCYVWAFRMALVLKVFGMTRGDGSDGVGGGCPRFHGEDGGGVGPLSGSGKMNEGRNDGGGVPGWDGGDVRASPLLRN